MKCFLITYHFETGTKQDWHKSITEFIAHIEKDPDLAGKISYQCMVNKETDEYYHLATPANEEAVKMLQSRDYFKKYTEKNRLISKGTLTVTPLEVIAHTK